MGVDISVIWFAIIVFATLMYIIMDGFDAVSYDQHAKAVLWFKDPLNLYPEDFRKLVQNQTTGG